MNFFYALRMECYKAIHCKTSKLFFLFIALPLFYGIAYDSGSQAATLEGEISAMGYASSCWAVLGFTGFAGILFVILAVFFFGKEKDDGQIKFIILRNCNRSQVFFAKYLSVVFLIVLSYMAMYVTAVGVYYIWIARSMRNTFFCSGLQELIWNITSDVLIVIQVIMVVNIVIALCMYRKSFFCTLAGIVISLLAFVVIQSVPVLEYCDSTNILDLYNDNQISTGFAWIYSIIYLTISLIPLWIGLKKFQKLDIK